MEFPFQVSNSRSHELGNTHSQPSKLQHKVSKLGARMTRFDSKPRLILKQFCMCLVEVVNPNKQLSVKKNLSFFLTSNSEGHGSHGSKGTILILGSVNVAMSVISTKLYFVEIS